VQRPGHADRRQADSVAGAGARNALTDTRSDPSTGQEKEGKANQRRASGKEGSKENLWEEVSEEGSH